MAPKKADAGKKAETPQDLSPSALESLLPTWNDSNIAQNDKENQTSMHSHLLLRYSWSCWKLA